SVQSGPEKPTAAALQAAQSPHHAGSRVCRSKVRARIPRAGVFGESRNKLIECAAGHHGASHALRAGSDLHFAGVMGVFDAAIGMATAQSILGCPRIECKASI